MIEFRNYDVLNNSDYAAYFSREYIKGENKMNKKVFISLPMHGRTLEEIKEEQNKIFNELQELFNKVYIELTLIETAVDGTGLTRLQCLGRSIAKLSDADYIYFADGWKASNGCLIEHECAKLYGIQIIKD